MSYPGAPKGLNDPLEWCRRIATVVNAINNGQLNINAAETEAAPDPVNDLLLLWDASLALTRSVTLANAVGYPHFKLGTISRGMTTAGGNVVVTGVGFR